MKHTLSKTLFIEAFAQARTAGAAARYVRVTLDETLVARLNDLRHTCQGLRLQHATVEFDAGIWRSGTTGHGLMAHTCDSNLQVSERGFKFVLEVLPGFARYETFFISFDELAMLLADPSATLFYTMGPTALLRECVRNAGEDHAGEVRSLVPVALCTAHVSHAAA